jgi:hypothetical protein
MIRRLLVPLLVLAVIGIAAVPAFATDYSTGAPAEHGGCLERTGERLARRDEFHAALAAELGVTAEEVSAAFTAVFSQRLSDAVNEGNLTARQAEKLLDRYESGALACGRIRHRW